MTRAKRIEAGAERWSTTPSVGWRMSAGCAIERRVTESETKLQELERYRGEYEKQFTQRAGRGIGATDLRDYQAFLARLAEAIRQQQALVRRARAERDAERQRWQEARETRQGARPRRRAMADRRASRDRSTRATRKR